jgi:hypothetical protein
VSGGGTAAGATSSRVGHLSQLDRATQGKLEAACNYINAEIAKVRGRVLKVSLACLVLAAIAYAFMWNSGVRDPRVPLFGAIGLIVIFASNEHRKLSRTYKQIVVTRVVNALGHGMSYSAESRFTKQDFHDMDLYLKRVEKWKAEDEVAGRKNAVEYAILEARGTRTEGSGKNRRTVTVFKGLIVRLDFNKHFHGHTTVVPNSDSQILGGLFGEDEERRNKALCRMESVLFEQAFSVYSTDQQEARYILTPKLMELIMETRGQFGDIRCSFHDSSVFLTIPHNANRFEISLFGSKVTPESTVGELAQVVGLAERLVDTLDLETRIWTKV